MLDTVLCNSADSLVDVTDERVAYPKRWIAVLVQMNAEKKTSARLNALGIENYVPVQREVRRWSDRKKLIDRVVIPMVVFVKINSNDERQLKKYSFIYKILTYPGQTKSAVIPDDQIERLKFMLSQSESPVEVTDKIMVPGDIVRVIRGPLKGLEGELYMIEGEKSCVVMRIECLGYACVHVSRNDVEKLSEN